MSVRKDYEFRLKSHDELVSKKINLYPHKIENSTSIEEIVKSPDSFMNKDVSVSGRLMALRFHGKLGFGDLVNDGFKIQIFLKFDVLSEKYEFFQKYIDRGDFVWVRGAVTRTQKGELSVLVRDFQILSKSLYDLPHQWFGVEDVETRYRARYLDLLLNPEVFEIFKKRSLIIREIRNYMDTLGFLEMETPVLQPVYGGANAKPFISYINSIKRDYYLRISDELYLKRLLVGGFSKIYEIAKDFRNEDIDTKHNPEFTMVEIYEAYKDYHDMMALTENLIKQVSLKVNNSLTIKINDNVINLSKPWKKVPMFTLLKESGIDPDTVEDSELKKLLEQYKINMPSYSRGIALAKLFEELWETKLIEPTFVIDYPAETTPLCKLHRSDRSLVERFELYINGLEIANGYSELNDPLRQEQTFAEELKRRTLGDEEAQQFDREFVEALKTGMPNAGGVGIGIDRLVMLLTSQKSLKEVILYPILAPKDQ